MADNKWIAEIERLREQNKGLLEVLKKAVDRPLEFQSLMKSNGIKIGLKNKIAVTLYTMIVEAATEAEDLIAKVGE